MKKNWLVLLVLLLWAAPVSMLAQFQYTTNADGLSAAITGYSGPSWDVEIPTNIDGFTVTGIGEKAFWESDLQSVVVPSTVTSIGAEAFEDCIALGSVGISESVTNIGSGAFFNCNYLTSIYFQGNEPTADTTVFSIPPHNFDPVTIYYLPGTTGWSASFAGCPTA